MKVLVLFGSPHEKGFTRGLLDYFLGFLKESFECEINVVSSYDESVRPCIGCEKCKSGKCVFDDMKKINFLVNSSDVVIVASPVYNASFPAPLKAIFDRFQPYYFKRNISDKKFVLLLTSGSEKIDYLPCVLFQINPVIKILGGNLLGEITLKGTDYLNKFDIDKFYSKSENKARNIIENFEKSKH